MKIFHYFLASSVSTKKSALNLIVAHLNVICHFCPSGSFKIVFVFGFFVGFLFICLFFAVFIDIPRYDFLYIKRTCLGFGVMLLNLWKSAPPLYRTCGSISITCIFLLLVFCHVILSPHMPGYFYCMTDICEKLYRWFQT